MFVNNIILQEWVTELHRGSFEEDSSPALTLIETQRQAATYENADIFQLVRKTLLFDIRTNDLLCSNLISHDLCSATLTCGKT